MEPELLSLRAYALRRGVSAEAVSKAVTSGRLAKSVTRVDGKPKIADAELADREWLANTRQHVDRPAAQLVAAPKPTVPTATAPSPPRVATLPQDDAGVPDLNTSRARREAALASMAELDLAERRGELVPADQARADVIDSFTLVRTRMLGVPSRLAQRMPHVAGEVVPVIDELIREALEELSADGQATKPRS